jgi:hypothetical protein
MEPMLRNDCRNLEAHLRELVREFDQTTPEEQALLIATVDRLQPLVEIWRESPEFQDIASGALLEVGRAYLEGSSAEQILAELRETHLPDVFVNLAQETVQGVPRALPLLGAWSGGILEGQARGVVMQTRHLLRDASALEGSNPAAARELRETAARLTEEHLPRTYVVTNSPKPTIPWRGERVAALFEAGFSTKYVARILGHTSDSNVGRMRKAFEARPRADHRPLRP